MQKVNIVEEKEVLKELETKNAKEDYVKLRSLKTITRYIEKPFNKRQGKIEYIGEQVIDSTTKPNTKVGTFKIYYNDELIDEMDALTSTTLHFSAFKYIKNNIFYYLVLILIIVLTRLTLKKKPKKLKRIRC